MITPAAKKEYAHWAVYVESIIDTAPLRNDETLAQKTQRRQSLEADPEQWFTYYFPKYTFAPPASFHIEATRRVVQHPENYEVRMWSRELAKSTRTMMEVLYLCLTGKKRYVLLISNSLDNAERLLAPYRANLEYNRRLINDYGTQQQAGCWTSAEFTTTSGAAFRALGAGQSPRGTRNEQVRPDVLLFDDVDTDADCRNPEIIAARWRWIEEAAIGTRSISQPTLIIFCGNRIANDCCVVRACQYADHVDEINIRDAQGHSTWPQKNTEAHINRVLKQKSHAAVQKEYYNNPLTEGRVFEKMHYKPLPPLSEYSMLVCYTDPSYKEGRHNDYKATVLVGCWQQEYHIIKAYVLQTNTAQMIDWHYDIAALLQGQSCYYFMEQNFMQDMFLNEFRNEGRRRKVEIPISGDTRKKGDKYTRIESLLEPLNRNGKLYLNEAEQLNPNMQRLEEQFITLAPGSRAHDDAPDAVEGAIFQLRKKMMLNLTRQIYSVPRQRNKKLSY